MNRQALIRFVSLALILLCGSVSLGESIVGDFSFSLREALPGSSREEVYNELGLESGQVLSGRFFYETNSPEIPIDNTQLPEILPDAVAYRSPSNFIELLADGNSIFREDDVPILTILAGSGVNGGAIADAFIVGGGGLGIDLGTELSFSLTDSEVPGRLIGMRELPSDPSQLDTSLPFDVTFRAVNLAADNLSFSLSVVPESSSAWPMIAGLLLLTLIRPTRRKV